MEIASHSFSPFTFLWKLLPSWSIKCVNGAHFKILILRWYESPAKHHHLMAMLQFRRQYSTCNIEILKQILKLYCNVSWQQCFTSVRLNLPWLQVRSLTFSLLASNIVKLCYLLRCDCFTCRCSWDSYISMTHYKLLILILSTYSMPHHLIPYHLSLLKNISKNLMSMPHHLSPLKNNFEKFK
jgi:hypothetical protein